MKMINKTASSVLLKKINNSLEITGLQKQNYPALRKGNWLAVIVMVILFVLPQIAAVAATTGRFLQGQQNPSSQSDLPANKGSRADVIDNQAGARNPSIIQRNSDQEYRIGPNDLVEIKIDKAEELSGTYRITASGSFTMTFLGRVVAIGKTSDQLATQIADGLRGRYLIEPNVRVDILQHSGQTYFIQGAVRSPGMFQVQGRLTLLELISIAGGLADNHGSTAYLIRKVRAQQSALAVKVSDPVETPALSTDSAEEITEFKMVKANISGLLRGNLVNNIVVEPDDIITIPITDVFFVAGAVEAPGSFPLKDGTTLRQAISLAQGPNSKAAMGKSIIYREDTKTGKQIEIKVDISAVMSGKKEDILIQPNDVIQIPDSRLKSIRNTVLTTFGFSATRIVRF